MNVLIIEDEAHASQTLEKMLSRFEGFHVSSILETVNDSIKWLKTNKPDIVFMDVNLADGNSLSVFDEVKISAPVIFTTGLNDDAIRQVNYPLSKISYLKKPFSQLELSQALTHARNIVNPNVDWNLTELKEIAQLIVRERQKLSFPVIDGIEFVTIGDIVVCKSAESWTEIFLKDGQKICVSKILGDVEKMLNGSPFFRTHRCYIINKEYVTRIKRIKGTPHAIMSNGMITPIARRRKDDFLAFIQ